MKALLIIAHGSRRVESNAEIRALADKVAQQAGGRYGVVGCAFLELAEPSIPAGIQQCIDQGADDITIMPFFLSAGRHVVEDVPAKVHSKQDEYPQITMHIAPYLGVSPLMPALILQASDIACACRGASCQYPTCLAR